MFQRQGVDESFLRELPLLYHPTNRVGGNRTHGLVLMGDVDPSRHSLDGPDRICTCTPEGSRF